MAIIAATCRRVNTMRLVYRLKQSTHSPSASPFPRLPYPRTNPGCSYTGREQNDMRNFDSKVLSFLKHLGPGGGSWQSDLTISLAGLSIPTISRKLFLQI